MICPFREGSGSALRMWLDLELNKGFNKVINQTLIKINTNVWYEDMSN
ncbi:MAG: hypothetical protein KAG14_03630 [Mycoplasmataceae bacterium]|nr:hypothetical protein [Mycoplasmataceae bacterium]